MSDSTYLIATAALALTLVTSIVAGASSIQATKTKVEILERSIVEDNQNTRDDIKVIRSDIKEILKHLVEKE